MKALRIKLSEQRFAEIASAARTRNVSKSEIIRERLTRCANAEGSLWFRMEDLVIQNDTLPRDLSSNKKNLSGYGKNRSGQ